MAYKKRTHKKKQHIMKTVLGILMILVAIGAIIYYWETGIELPENNETELQPKPEHVGEEDLPDLEAEKDNPDNEELETDPKNIDLKYVLRGKTSNIQFTVYGGVNNYLSELPRHITYYVGEPEPTTKDFVMRFLDDENQKDRLKEFVEKIKTETNNKDDQARIAISLVQQIPYDWKGFTSENIENRYPYEVIYDNVGVCAEKSRLLAFLLRELGFDVVLFHFELENHMAVGIMCPVQYSYKDTGYCFIETANPSIVTDDQREYIGVGKLTSIPEIIHISEGFSFDSVSEEYNDAKEWIRLNNLSQSSNGILDETDYNKWCSLVNKYGIDISN